ncbi:tyrosine-type recombinase/integrase [uncultured Arsenicicoccus sp.]|uniref:tyrosine-type recombinase/integrase n=1 Tax=uncultured Arsenicicoccus sp. TaxID=491339 RepID=UPI002593B5C0|nr:tyrosine-type recombinase/integrase [uncultured Arsenicicoccus sp.]
MRHTGATWMADAGIPLHVLQDILGHASMETTRGYLHPDDRHLVGGRAGQRLPFRRRTAQTGPAQRPLGQGPVMRARLRASSLAVVLVPFWSPYPQGVGSRRRRCPQATARRHTRGTRGGRRKRPPDMTKPRRETCSHLGFYVGLTGFEPATP